MKEQILELGTNVYLMMNNKIFKGIIVHRIISEGGLIDWNNSNTISPSPYNVDSGFQKDLSKSKKRIGYYVCLELSEKSKRSNSHVIGVFTYFDGNTYDNTPLGGENPTTFSRDALFLSRKELIATL